MALPDPAGLPAAGTRTATGTIGIPMRTDAARTTDEQLATGRTSGRPSATPASPTRTSPVLPDFLHSSNHRTGRVRVRDQRHLQGNGCDNPNTRTWRIARNFPRGAWRTLPRACSAAPLSRSPPPCGLGPALHAQDHFRTGPEAYQALLYWPRGAHDQFDLGAILSLGRTGPLPFWPWGTRAPI